MRRVLKPGGILASRDGAESHYFPRSLDLDNIFTENMLKVFDTNELPGSRLPSWCRQVGFDVDGGKVKFQYGTTSVTDARGRQWWADGIIGRLTKGDQYYDSWKKAGLGDDLIEICKGKFQQWANTPDASYVVVQAETLAWK